MCPSFRVTREEEHSTRGRAHLLWEMTQGDVIKDGWNNEAVKESLDLCLACKGCKSDCPVGVDVATYKAEFLSHYYEANSRPLSAKALANFDIAVRTASHIPGLVNLTTQLPGLRDLTKLATGIAPRRRIPALAPETFQEWWAKQRAATQRSGTQRSGNQRSAGVPRAVEGASRSLTRQRPLAQVLLWADTFNNHFVPATAIAAAEVLEAAGFEVSVPQAHLCCGRPLYDVGELDRAKALLLRIMDALSVEIEQRMPIVVLEPSCAAVFRDELINLFPNDARARALSKQVFLLSEFLEQYAKDFAIPELARKALIHGHCHHKALMKMTAEESVLRRMGIDFTAPAAGCCGMAGAFGFEKEKYEISRAIGELELLPAVRQTPTDWLIVADGFSCREQIAQETDRHALHLAEVVQMALRESTETPDGLPLFDAAPRHYPEDAWVQPHEDAVQKSMKRTGLALAGAAVGAALLLALARRR
jgi:Fe-S oxidoreductase